MRNRGMRPVIQPRFPQWVRDAARSECRERQRVHNRLDRAIPDPRRAAGESAPLGGPGNHRTEAPTQVGVRASFMRTDLLEPCAVKVARTVLRGGGCQQWHLLTRQRLAPALQRVATFRRLSRPVSPSPQPSPARGEGAKPLLHRGLILWSPPPTAGRAREGGRCEKEI